MKTFSNHVRIPAYLLLLVGLMLPFSVAADPTSVNAYHPNLPEISQGVTKGGVLEVTGLDLDQFGIVDLELERFSVFAPDAEILVDGSTPISPPNNAYFRGRADGLPNAIVLLIVPEHGKIRGIITDEAGVWLIAGNSGQGGALGLSNRKVKKEDLASLPPFECGTDALPIDIGELAGEKTEPQVHLDTSELAANVTHTARVAIETDYEYYAKFGNVTAALNYTGDLFAYSSAVYEREVNTNLIISYIKFWPNGATSDPWSATSGTLDALLEFRDYWNINMGSEDRTIAHMLSGKSLGGGIAYISVLCNKPYGYGLSASLNGNFDINNPGVVWDIVVVSHEIGHNFSSQHTQDYCGIGGNSNPVDLCYNSAAGCGAALGLPGVGTLSGGVTANSPGTIMSYCHQVIGGMSNISFTFGKDHIYGVAADRVPLVMYNHVLDSAATYPSCLALAEPRFIDVPFTHWAWRHIEAIAQEGITGGCGGGNYCPDSEVSRAQMAVFLLRGIHGGVYTPPAATGTVFADVPSTFWAASWIEQLAAEGITSGCGGGNYCPSSDVSRAQMAVFLLRSKYGSAYAPPAASGTVFADVPVTFWAAGWIEQLAAEGITVGCGGGNYCPNSDVNRAQMAVFLQRTFNLVLPPVP